MCFAYDSVATDELNGYADTSDVENGEQRRGCDIVNVLGRFAQWSVGKGNNVSVAEQHDLDGNGVKPWTSSKVLNLRAAAVT